jgi:hypothetical protein
MVELISLICPDIAALFCENVEEEIEHFTSDLIEHFTALQTFRRDGFPLLDRQMKKLFAWIGFFETVVID